VRRTWKGEFGGEGEFVKLILISRVLSILLGSLLGIMRGTGWNLLLLVSIDLRLELSCLNFLDYMHSFDVLFPTPYPDQDLERDLYPLQEDGIGGRCARIRGQRIGEAKGKEKGMGQGRGSFLDGRIFIILRTDCNPFPLTVGHATRKSAPV
jgi:hypothetical protein